MKKIRVSATSANIGAGFDSMGMALNLYNEIELDIYGDKLKIVTDVGLPTDDTNLIYQSMTEVFKISGKSVGVYFKQINNIPVASGLGSSAACVVLGVNGANALLGYPLNERDIVNLCCKLDGHPDNVIPAIKGGITAGVMNGDEVEYIKCNGSEKLCLVTATPDFPLETSKSRAVLPKNYSREDVVYSLSRAIVTFGALINDDINLLKIVDDKIHQPYRIPLIKGYQDVVETMKERGAISTFISGAGPTIIGIYKKFPQIILPYNWTVRNLRVENEGVKITDI